MAPAVPRRFVEGVALADPFLGAHGAVHGPLVRSLKESELASWFPQLCVLIITLTYANLRAGRAQRAAPETGKLKILPPPVFGRPQRGLWMCHISAFLASPLAEEKLN